MLSMTLLLIVLGLTVELFFTGARSFSIGQRQHDLSRQATVVLDRVTRNLESARPDSLTVEAESMAFLSCRDDQNQLQLNPDGSPSWQAYEIYFRESATQELRERRLPLASPTRLLQPIERYNDGSGLHPLSFYLSSRKVVARQVAVFALQRPQPERVDLRLRLELPALGRQAARHLEVSTAVVLRVK